MITIRLPFGQIGPTEASAIRLSYLGYALTALFIFSANVSLSQENRPRPGGGSGLGNYEKPPAANNIPAIRST